MFSFFSSVFLSGYSRFYSFLQFLYLGFLCFLSRKEIKGENPKLDKKPKTEFPAAIRRSLRLLQKPPELPSHADGQIRTRECLSMQEAHVAGTSSNDQQFIDTVMTMSHKALLSFSPKKRGKEDGGCCFNRGSLVLREENVACVVPALISDVGFFPSEERAMIVVGDKLGNVGFWDTDCEEEEEEEEGDGIYVYGPHSAPVSGISIQPFLLSKVFNLGNSCSWLRYHLCFIRSVESFCFDLFDH